MVRVRDAAKFLKEGDKVKVTVIFKSREINHPEIARRLLEKMIVDTADVAVVEKPPALEARTMTMFLSPKPGVEKKEKDAKEAKTAAPKAEATPEQAAVA
jgi:translation initiation factor IF-3